MFYYGKMRWDLKGMSFNDLWILENKEAETGIQTLENGMVQHLYKVAAEQYVIVIGDLPSAIELDRIAMGRLPMHEHLIFEEVFSLVEGFTVDVQGYLKPRREEQEKNPKFLYYVQMAWNPRERDLDTSWNGAVESLKEFEAGRVLGVYRLAGLQRIIAIVDVAKADDLNALTALSALRSSAVEKVWALRDYHLFAEDVRKNYNV